MRFYLSRVGGVPGLVQVEGGTANRPPPPAHPRHHQITDGITELQKRRYNAGTMPSVLTNCLAAGHWDMPSVMRASKWADYDGPGEPIVRRLFRQVFRCSKELGTVPARMLDQQDGYIGHAEQTFLEWAERVARSWGGRADSPLLDFPTAADARVHYTAHP